MTRSERAAMARRWQAALHESGHLVAGLHLLADGRVQGAALTCAGGQAFIPMPSGERLTHAEAVALRCGAEAEGLASRRPAPSPRGRRPGARAAEVAVQMAMPPASGPVVPSVPDDATRFLRGCKDVIEVRQALGAARAFVEEHEREILRTARSLFLVGSVTTFRRSRK